MGNKLGVQIDVSGLKEMQKKFEEAKKHSDEFVEKEIKKITALLLSGTIDDTPRDTSNLARHWTNHSEGHVSSAPSAEDWAQSESVNQKGKTYEMQVVNNASYAPYVEWGHRTRGGKGWVPGQFMLTTNVARINKKKDSVIKKDLDIFLGKYLK